MSNKFLWNLAKGALLLLIIMLLSKNILWDYYKVSSGSMLPAIAPGDYIFVNVLTYRLGLDSGTKPRIKSHRIFTIWNIHKGDVVIFNKPEWNYPADSRAFYGPEYVKRCYGEPGDTIKIDMPAPNSGYESRVPGKYNIKLFPQDTSFKWTLNKMGPVWVPKKGRTLYLDSNGIRLYQTVLNFEGKSVAAIRNTTYSFKNDYFFFLGDNFYESEDSRYWGFVPRTNLLGKVLLKL